MSWRFSILIFAIFASAATGTVAEDQLVEVLKRADQLFQYGADPQKEKQGVKLLEKQLVRFPNAYELLWRLSRGHYYLGVREGNKRAKVSAFNAGVKHGRKARGLDRKIVHAHFWIAANLGGIAKIKKLNAMIYVPQIRSSMLQVKSIDPRYEDARAHLALGELFKNLPFFLGGNVKKAVKYFEEGLTLAPDNVDMRLALAQSYLKMRKKDKACRELQRLLQIQPKGPRAHADKLTIEEAKQLRSKSCF